MTMQILTQEYLKESLVYDLETGIFTWRVRPLRHFVNSHRMNLINSKCAGKEAGCYARGYVFIGLAGQMHRAHRLAFLYMTGNLPDQTDHINHNGQDNRWCNLRNVTVKENNRNISLRKSNIYGAHGVAFHKQTGKWRARIGPEHIGLFDSLENAIKARAEAQAKAAYHVNHGAVL